MVNNKVPVLILSTQQAHHFVFLHAIII